MQKRRRKAAALKGGTVPSGTCITEYSGVRGVTWKINYRDAEVAR
jgi:hypothetical protein